MLDNGKIGIGTTNAPSVRLELENNGGGGTSKNIMLKLTNSWNASGINEPTIQFDNGQALLLSYKG